MSSHAKGSRSPSGAGPSRRATWTLLALILAWSLGSAGWFATLDLSAPTDWDERYVLPNLVSALQGELAPVDGFYPRLSYLPQAGLLAISKAYGGATGDERFTVLTPEGELAPSGYLLARWTSTLYGAAGLVVTFLLGRRLFSPAVGLLAAFSRRWFPGTSTRRGSSSPTRCWSCCCR